VLHHPTLPGIPEFSHRALLPRLPTARGPDPQHGRPLEFRHAGFTVDTRRLGLPVWCTGPPARASWCSKHSRFRRAGY
jgi:hypothetical protein